MALTDFERRVLNDFRRRRPPETPARGEDPDAWLAVGLRLLLELGRMLRGARAESRPVGIHRKPDGSVVTDWDLAAEWFARRWLRQALPDTAFMGEETGGRMTATRTAAIDPIDGSWSFVSRDAAFGVSLAFFAAEETVVGLVLNPSTGELAYAAGETGSRLLQLDLFGEGDSGAPLPWPLPEDGDPRPLVNLPPAAGHRPLARRFKDAWEAGRLRHVKSTGGSPALSLLEAAKGRYVYVHPWAAGAAMPWDLAAGVKLVCSAGGRVVDADGYAIRPLGHQGLLVAGIDAAAVTAVRGLLEEEQLQAEN